MPKVLAPQVKLDDIVEFETPSFEEFSQIKQKLSGIITHIQPYPNWRLNDGSFLPLIYIALSDKGAYLRLTDEITKLVLPDKEREEMILTHKLKRLTRVVNTQGSDPEIFVVDKNDQVIPSFLFLNDQKNAHRTRNTETIFNDGFQAEFNIVAGSCLDGSIRSFYNGLYELNRLAKKHNPEARLTIKPTMDIPPHMLIENKPEHVQFGCMPSKNVYGMEGIKADGKDVPFRSAGGHIHLALTDAQKTKIPQYIKALDAILGVAGVAMFAKFDDPRRRQYYGLAGEYRTPKHGLEYRPLSNVWMCHPTVTYIIFELARKVITLVDKDLFNHWKYNEEEVVKCINECNVMVASSILDENETMFKNILSSFCYNDEKKIKVVYNTFMFGVENLITEVDNVEHNWNLNRGFDYHQYQIANMPNNDNFKKLLEYKI